MRHHSPALAAAIPRLLDEIKPKWVLIELPMDFQRWLPWLSHEELQTPVALAGVSEDSSLAFYPFADFSPELSALRWARHNKVKMGCLDLPLQCRPERKASLPRDQHPALTKLYQKYEVKDSEQLWERIVEARVGEASVGQLRHLALLFGALMRQTALESGGVPLEDLCREKYMGKQIASYSKKSPHGAVIVGAFHAEALAEYAAAGACAVVDVEIPPKKGAEPVLSLIAYSSELFDSRSGYPAGIRDPLWQQRVFEALAVCQSDRTAHLDGDRTAHLDGDRTSHLDGDRTSHLDGDRTSHLDGVVASCIVEVCRLMREKGHVASLPDEREALRLARDLASLRGLGAPSRQEFLEGLQSALGQGERLGRARVLARALDEVVVGRVQGALAPGTPQSGLLLHVNNLFAQLRLPGPQNQGEEPKLMRLSPRDSKLDRQRETALQRMCVCGIPYGEERAGQAAGGVERLTTVWELAWLPTTAPLVELAGLRGVTLEQAACGELLCRYRELEQKDELTAAKRLGLLEAAAQCGLCSAGRKDSVSATGNPGGLVDVWLGEIFGDFLRAAGLAEIVGAYRLVQRIKWGHIAALPSDVYTFPKGLDESELIAAAIRALDGMAGSKRAADARAALELVQLFLRQEEEKELGEGRLLWALTQLERHGAPFMGGVASLLLVLLGKKSANEFGEYLASKVQAAANPDAMEAMADTLRGALTVSGPLFEGTPGFSFPLLIQIETMSDEDFLQRLAALRHGFEALSPAARSRLLHILSERLETFDPQGKGLDVKVNESPQLLALYAAADNVGAKAIKQMTTELPPATTTQARELPTTTTQARELPASTTHEPTLHPPLNLIEQDINSHDRWRLILGQQRQDMSPRAKRLAATLEELYGSGKGEGSQVGLDGSGGGQESSFPSTRQWAEELESLFGTEVCQEVLGRAAVEGRAGAIFELDSEKVTPSVELLEQVLSLKGGLPESQLPRLRKLVAKVVSDLTKALAVRVRPALGGFITAVPTRRPGGPLDLRRTINANIKTIRRRPNGQPLIVPEKLIFKSRATRSMDWHIILVVDVSGSMEPSVIYSAMMAAILNGLPALSVDFLAFSTEVIDLSDRVDDPLSLLLEISVGGGTHIAKGLRYAREKIKVPQRSIVILVSDFEEGYGVDGLLGEVRSLAQTGATLLGLAALSDDGAPRYCQAVAELVAGCGMSVAALTPLELARWVGEKVK